MFPFKSNESASVANKPETLLPAKSLFHVPLSLKVFS